MFVNGVAIPGTRYGSGSGVVQNNGYVITNLAADDVITLRNSSDGTVTLTTAGGTGQTVNASITIKKLDS